MFFLIISLWSCTGIDTIVHTFCSSEIIIGIPHSASLQFRTRRMAAHRLVPRYRLWFLRPDLALRHRREWHITYRRRSVVSSSTQGTEHRANVTTHVAQCARQCSLPRTVSEGLFELFIQSMTLPDLYCRTQESVHDGLKGPGVGLKGNVVTIDLLLQHRENSAVRSELDCFILANVSGTWPLVSQSDTDFYHKESAGCR